MALALSGSDLSHIDEMLAETDRTLDTYYPGDNGSRQPVHTVYVPADRFTGDLVAEWGAHARAAADAHGGLERVALLLGYPPELAMQVAARAETKLSVEPIEDIRLDFEDGFGNRGDDIEDAVATAAAKAVSTSVASGTAPPFIGIRFKCFEEATRARGLRTLDLFIATLAEAGELPVGLTLTLPKVSTVAQVQAMDFALGRLEEVHGFQAGRLRFEVQVETPQLILGPEGSSPLAQVPLAAPGRVSGLHYGTYDYSASLEISAAYQSMEHPAADFAKQVMQLAVAGTGIRLSDGSTNVLPVGEQTVDAWLLHARLVRRSLERGFYQGWDMHPAQLVTRFLATYAFYREGLEPATRRLKNYVEKNQSGILDEPATARALARFVARGVACGAVDALEVSAQTGISVPELHHLAFPKLSATDERIQ